MSGTTRFARRAMVRLGLSLPLLSAACAGPARSTDLHDTLEHLCEKNRVPGLAAAVWRGPVRIAAAAAGVRKHNDPTPVTVDDQWHLGSDTKAMTATLVGLFVDRGNLRFEDVLGEALSDWRLHPGYAGVSIEQLLQHRGGTPPDVPDDLKGLLTDGDPSTARAAVVRAILARPPTGAAGKFSYSNIGYLILGVILERKGGTSWESLMRTELFTPLRMDSAGFGPPGDPATVDQPWGHTDNLEPMPPADPRSDNPPAYGPAGTVHCALADWAKFLSQHLAGARGDPTILTPTTMSRLHQPPPDGDYAAGWIVTTRDWANGPVLTHVGSNNLWTAETWLAPKKNLTFTAVTNRGGNTAHETTATAIDWLVETYADA